MNRMILVLLLTSTVAGCSQDQNERLAHRLDSQARLQDEQAKRLSESHSELVEAARSLVEQDATARREWIELQSQLETARLQIISARDELESERRDIETQRHNSPIIAETLFAIGGLLLCSTPLLLTAMMFKRWNASTSDEVTDLLLNHISVATPRLSNRDAPTAS